jgi:hypothetical protein
VTSSPVSDSKVKSGAGSPSTSTEPSIRPAIGIVRQRRVTDKSRATAVSLSPNASARLRPQMLPRRRGGQDGARACNRWSRSVACVPTAAKERAPHLGEILRCSGSICRRLEVSLEDLSARYRSARRLPRPRADHVGVVSAAAPTTPLSSAAHTHGGAVRTARRRQTFGMG